MMGIDDGIVGNRLEKIVSRGADVMHFLAMVLIIVAMLLTTVDAIMRFIFSAPIPGAFHLEAFILVALISFPLAYCQKIKAHIRVDLVISRIHGKPFYIIEMITLVFTLILFGLATYTTGEDAWRSFITGNYEMGVVKLPIWPSKAFIPLGTGFLCLVLMVDIGHLTKAIFRHRPDNSLDVEDVESKGLI